VTLLPACPPFERLVIATSCSCHSEGIAHCRSSFICDIYFFVPAVFLCLLRLALLGRSISDHRICAIVFYLAGTAALVTSCVRFPRRYLYLTFSFFLVEPWNFRTFCENPVPPLFIDYGEVPDFLGCRLSGSDATLLLTDHILSFPLFDRKATGNVDLHAILL